MWQDQLRAGGLGVPTYAGRLDDPRIPFGGYADLSLVQMLPQDASLIVSLDPYSADGTFAAIASLDQGRQGPEVCIFDSSFNLASTRPIPSWQTGGPSDSTAGTLIFHDASGTGLFILLDNSDSGGIDTWAIARL